MCRICVEWQQEKLTVEEVYSNLQEMSDAKSISQDHIYEIIEMIGPDEILNDDDFLYYP